MVFTGRIEVKPGSGEEGVDDGLLDGVLRLGFVGEPTEDVVVEDDRPLLGLGRLLFGLDLVVGEGADSGRPRALACAVSAGQ